MDDGKHWNIQRRLKAKKHRQRLEAAIYLLERQAEQERARLGHALPATLKKLHHRKLKLNDHD